MDESWPNSDHIYYNKTFIQNKKMTDSPEYAAAEKLKKEREIRQNNWAMVKFTIIFLLIIYFSGVLAMIISIYAV